MLEHSEATLGARLVLIGLADYTHENGTNACPSVETLSKMARMSPKGARDALRRLEAAGEIRCVGISEYGTREYELVGLVDAAGGAEVSSGVGRKLASEKGRELPPIEDLEEREEQEPKPKYIARAWLACSPPLIAHKEAYFSSRPFLSKSKAALKTYSPEEIATAIRNYATVFASPDYFWTHAWTAADFLARGLDKFVDEAKPLTNFRQRRGATADDFGDLDDLGS